MANGRWRRTKRIYWACVDWITRRVFLLAVLPWTLPILGGLLISTHLGKDFSHAYVWTGVGIILISTVPLGFNALGLQRKEQVEDQIDAQERQCLGLAAALIPRIPTDPNVSFDERQHALQQAMREISSSLVRDVYPNIPGIRATVYRYGQDADSGVEAFSPAFSNGRTDEASTHLAGSDRFNDLFELATGDTETRVGIGVENLTYKSFMSASIYRDTNIYGVISLDSSINWEFTKRDTANLLVLARLLSAFFSGAEHHGLMIERPSGQTDPALVPAQPGLFTRLCARARMSKRGGRLHDN